MTNHQIGRSSIGRRTMLSNRPSGPLLMVAMLMIVLTGTSAQLMSCPQVCSCIWRNGKQTTICENQNLISIPNQIQPSTQVLDLNTNNFQILPSKAFQERGLINLQKLFLPRCKLGAIAEDAFVQLTNLVELDLSENLLTHVPVKALANTTNLRRLLLNGNHIATINAESFSALGNLKFLNLSGCQTHTIEARAFLGLHDLEYLYLHSNHLTTLPYSVVQDLPALYSFDLYRNPWHCNCEMRATRDWMLRNNVGQSIPAACELPMRLTGLMWNSLDLDDFACEPDIISTTVEVAKTVGSNATLSCLVKGLPEPKIHWYIDDGFYRNLSSATVRGDKYTLVEERSEGTVHSMLTIIGLEGTDDTGSFICSAENRAGMKNKNFTVSVLPSSAFGVAANWSKVELAGGIVGILISLVIAFVLITLILIRSKRFSSALNNAKKFSSNGETNGANTGDDLSIDKKPIQSVTHTAFAALLKNGNNLVYPGQTQFTYSSAQHATQRLSMLGLDGIDKKPEIFLQPNGGAYGNTPVPDLVPASNGTLVTNNNSGYELNTYSQNGIPYTQSYQHGHQNSDTSMMMSQTTEGGYYGDSYLTSGHDPGTMYQADNDGLYRAVMVNQHTTTTATPSPRYNALSAANLYNQYLSHHDLRATQEQRISPTGSFSQLHHRHLLAQQQQQQQSQQQQPYDGSHHQAYVLGNPSIGVINQEMYSDDDVFCPPSVTSTSIAYDPHMPMFQAPVQPIYGISSKRSSPWSQATVVPNHTMMNTVTPTPHQMMGHLRYSPDEGYGEDGSSTTVGGVPPMIPVGHLEGTEV